ncbi:MAG: hypothetical protein IPM82_17315 [Saprospiraceae bacterium]|nr:hypothetical protein [Saprospiraceae bacterium]
MYIALVWKIFGKTLCASHFAMLPFLFGIVYFLQAIGKKLLGQSMAPWMVLLCFVDPVLAGQSVLVSPDLVLVCCFLMSVWAIWSNNSCWLALATIGLGLVSMRGMMIGVAMFAFSIYVSDKKFSVDLFFKKLLPFLPGGLMSASYLLYHWTQTGWIGYHAGSTWAPSFEPVDFQGFIRNIGIMGWRFLDFGRVFVWIAIASMGFIGLRKSNWKIPKPNRHQTGWQLVALTVFVFLAVGPSQLFYKGLLAHRYFLPFFLSLNFLVLYFLCSQYSRVVKKRWYNLAIPALCLGLATGNFWVYPQKTAMGWDSTLAHLPWYSLLNQTEEFIKKANIPYSQIGTAFPNIGDREIYELNGVGEGFVDKNLPSNCYVFYSNIMNDFSDAEIDELKRDWEIVFSRELGGVCTVLYKNPIRHQCAN